MYFHDKIISGIFFKIYHQHETKMFGYNTNEYELKTELANCCNGIATVFLARHRPTGDAIAIKRYKLDKADKENNLIMVKADWKNGVTWNI